MTRHCLAGLFFGHPHQPGSALSSTKTSCGRFLNQFKIANLDFSPEKTVSIKSSLCFMSGEYSCLVASKSLSRDYQWPKRTITQLKTRVILSCYNEFEQTYINLLSLYRVDLWQIDGPFAPSTPMPVKTPCISKCPEFLNLDDPARRTWPKCALRSIFIVDPRP